jgi:hypothetical protein
MWKATCYCVNIQTAQGLKPTMYPLTYRVGQNHIYTVYIRWFWQENHQIYGHIRCIYTVLANPHLYTPWAKHLSRPKLCSSCFSPLTNTKCGIAHTLPALHFRQCPGRSSRHRPHSKRTCIWFMVAHAFDSWWHVHLIHGGACIWFMVAHAFDSWWHFCARGFSKHTHKLIHWRNPNILTNWYTDGILTYLQIDTLMES